MNSGLLKFSLFFFVLGLLASCNTTKYVPEGKYLLHNYEIKSDSRQINRDEIDNYVRQKPNKSILGFKFHLFLYNLSKAEKDNGINRWLRRIGEEPVIFDVNTQNRTVTQMELYLRNKGYYKGIISDTTIIKNQKAQTIYTITLNEPFRIGNIEYEFEDGSLAVYILPDTVNSMLKRGEIGRASCRERV